MSGWIKLHRSIQDNDLWLAEPFTYGQAWTDLLLNASHKQCSFWVRRVEVKLERGQIGWSEITLAERWKWSRGKVRRYLGMLEIRGMIVQQKTQLTSVITICNYSNYQDDDAAELVEIVQQTEHQTVHQTDNRQYTYKNDKNDKKISSNEEIISAPENKSPKAPKKAAQEIDYGCWPSMPSEQVLTDWLAMRKNAKATTSQTVITTFGKELTKAVQAGYSVDQCLSECITRNWRGFKLDWLHNAGVNPYGYQTSNTPSFVERYENPTARILRLARECEPAEHPGVIEAEFKAH